MKIRGEIDVRVVDRGRVLLRPVEYYSNRLGRSFVIPKGFATDGVTIPRFLWWFLSPFGEAFIAAILHDYLVTRVDGMKWRDATDLFGDALKVTGVPRWKIPVIKFFVNIYGVFYAN